MTDKDAHSAQAWLCYDADCSICSSLIERFRPFLQSRGFSLAPLQTPWVQQALGIMPGAPLAELRLILPDGRSPGGADALLEIAKRTVLGWPLLLGAALPGVKFLLRLTYRWLAARRSCLSGACTISPTQRGHWTDWIALVVLPLAAFFLRTQWPPWVFMWVLAFTLFLGCKWLVVRRAVRRHDRASVLRFAGFLIAWPGMDPEPFFLHGTTEAHEPVPYRKWTFTLIKCFAGLALIGLAAHSRDLSFPVARGWLGMLGLILFLHFGLFEILALVWRSKGVRLRPVMNRPLCAASLADFWGKRWNTAFNALAQEFVFVPLRFRWGSVWATLGTFFASGLIHEAVISVPARGGYGLPTSYFLFQGLAILFQRSQMGVRLGLGNGWRGRAFAVAVAAGPAFWLFHPFFIKNVIVPMLDALGSI